MDSKLQSIFSKIKTMQSIASSTHSRLEAETMLAMAAKLIAQYQIDMAEMEAQAAHQEEIDTQNEYILYETGRSSLWKTNLVVGVASLHGLFLLQCPIRDSATHRRGSRFRVLGKKHSIELAIYMFETMMKMVKELADKEFPTNISVINGKLTAKRGVNTNKESWCYGCVLGFIKKMKEERGVVMKTASGAAMVLLSGEVAKAKEAYCQANPKTKFTNAQQSKAHINGREYAAGFEKGQTLSVNAGLGANSSTVRQLGR
jgi:hypothetical protein